MRLIPFTLLLSITACAAALAAPRITAVTLFADAGGVPGEQVTVFEPSERLQHFRIDLSETVDASHRFTIAFFAVHTSAGSGIDVTQVELAGQAADRITTHVDLPQDWPVGTYELRVSLDGKPIGSRSYKVEAY